MKSFTPLLNKLPRGLECLLALTGLILLTPFLLLCAIFVRISSRGNIFFRQHRVGRGGEIFTLYKFRTMYKKNDGLLITAATDRRITPVGAVLRKYKLDEIPQLYNVLIGDMSFVGPRPEVPQYVDFNNPIWEKILIVRPGITDPVTLILRNEEKFLAKAEDKDAFYREVIQPFKIKGYLKYLETKCLTNDLKIIIQTGKVVLFPKTAPSPNLESMYIAAHKLN